jgi:hypothetical protein
MPPLPPSPHRCLWTLAGLGVLLAAATLTAPAPALAARPPPPRPHPCSNLSAARAEIERLVAQRLPPSTPIHVDLAATAPDRVRVRIFRGDEVYERELPASPAECLELPHTVILLAESWLQSSLQLPPPAPPPESPPAADPTRQPVAASLASTPERSRPHRLPRRLALAAGAFAAIGALHQGPHLAAGAEIDPLPRLGLALHVAWQAPVVTKTSRGSVSASLLRIDLLARYSLLARPKATLDLLAGPGLSLFSAKSEGFRTNFAKTLGDAAFAAALRYRHALPHDTAGFLSLDLHLRSRNEQLYVAGFRPVLALPRARAALSLGLLWDPHSLWDPD